MQQQNVVEFQSLLNNIPKIIKQYLYLFINNKMYILKIVCKNTKILLLPPQIDSLL